MGLGQNSRQVRPTFKTPVRTAADVAALPKLDVNVDLDYVMNAVRTIRGALGGRVPLIGFQVRRTLATYMIEGAGSKVPTRQACCTAIRTPCMR